MSAALKSYVPRPTPSRLRRARPRTYQQQLQSPPSRVTAEETAVQPQRPIAQPVPLPPRPTRTLRVLSGLQLVSSVLATTLVGLSLVSYGASVYVDRQLSQSTRRLDQLQRSEQQLTTVNEVLKSHMAQQADSPAAGLTPPTPEHVIFLKPAQQRQQPDSTSVEDFMLVLPRVTMPMGY